MFITKLANFLELGLLVSQTSGLTIVQVLFYLTENVIKTLQFFVAELMNAVDGYLLFFEVTVGEGIGNLQNVGHMLHGDLIVILLCL